MDLFSSEWNCPDYDCNFPVPLDQSECSVFNQYEVPIRLLIIRRSLRNEIRARSGPMTGLMLEILKGVCKVELENGMMCLVWRISVFGGTGQVTWDKGSGTD